MDLHVVRHAVAYERDEDRWPDDARRPLTPEGEERFRLAAGGLALLVPGVDLVLCSPFARAWRTAEILQKTGWPAPVSCEELEPDYPPHKLVGVLSRYGGLGSVAVVGHRPGLHDLVSYLLTGDVTGEDCAAPVQIKKGGAARLQLGAPPEPGAASLRWLLTPKVLRALCSEPPPDPEG